MPLIRLISTARMIRHKYRRLFKFNNGWQGSLKMRKNVARAKWAEDSKT
jgi:hypothetical protein